jgi:hypothetical protein
MNTKITKTEAAALAYDNACAAYTAAQHQSIRIGKSIRILRDGGTLNTNQEDVLYDACYTRLGMRAYNMTIAAAAEMAAQIVRENLAAASALCDELGEIADKLEQAAARREARKAAAKAAEIAAAEAAFAAAMAA